MKNILLGCVIALSAGTGCAYSPVSTADTARVLGATYLTRAENDRDVLNFRQCRRNINAIKLEVDRGQVEVEHVWVRFANGQREVLNVRDYIHAGSSSRWIDLNGGERCVKAIGIIGDTQYSRDQARVKILAR